MESLLSLIISLLKNILISNKYMEIKENSQIISIQESYLYKYDKITFI